MLSIEDFKLVVKSTPLVSIDLIVENAKREILVGKRSNKPAQGYWFVPGGRILKGETFDKAFNRLCLKELGVEYDFNHAKFLGPYQHLYSDNFMGNDFSTHYVVLGYKILCDINIKDLPKDQHEDYRWFTKQQLLSHCSVHSNTKAYFE